MIFNDIFEYHNAPNVIQSPDRLSAEYNMERRTETLKYYSDQKYI